MQEAMREDQGLYRQEFEHDNCGIGAVVNIKGKKTHETVANALRIVEHLEHRAGKDAEGKTGDGVGILLQISHKFFKKACKKEGFDICEEREYGIAQFFFPQHEIKRAQAKKMFEIIVEKEGLELLGWRTVPVIPEVLGHKAKECMPCIMQAFIKKPEEVEKGLPFDRMLYIAPVSYTHLRHRSRGRASSRCYGRCPAIYSGASHLCLCLNRRCNRLCYPVPALRCGGSNGGSFCSGGSDPLSGSTLPLEPSEAYKRRIENR